jgi:hypothetical protein
VKIGLPVLLNSSPAPNRDSRVPHDHRSVLDLGNVVHAAMAHFNLVSPSPVITGRVHLGLTFSPAFCTKLSSAMRGSSHWRKQGLAMKAYDHLLGSGDSVRQLENQDSQKRIRRRLDHELILYQPEQAVAFGLCEPSIQRLAD